MERNFLIEHIEITQKFNFFIETTQKKRNSGYNESEKASFLSSLSLDLKEFPDEKAISAIFEANLRNK